MGKSVEWGQVDETGTKVFRLHEGQSQVMKAKARFKAAIAGTGGGKTVLGSVWCYEQIARVADSRDLSKDPLKGMIVAPTYPILVRATSPTFVSMLAGTDLEGRYIESKSRYELPQNMGTIWLMSADRYESLEGGQFDWAWLDEAGQMSYRSWVAIQGRLGQRQGPALLTTTPYIMNWLHSDFFERAKAGDPDYFVHQWSSDMNPVYPKEEMERARRTLSDARFRMRYQGEMIAMEGLVYPQFNSAITDFTDLPVGELVGGIDFGWAHPFACVAAIQDLKNRLWIFYERYRTQTPLEIHARAIPRRAFYYADPSRPDMISELKRADIQVVGNKIHDLVTGVDAVSARLYHRTLKIHPSLHTLRYEAGQYRWPGEDGHVERENPVKGADHALDALRYLVSGCDRHQIATRISA